MVTTTSAWDGHIEGAVRASVNAGGLDTCYYRSGSGPVTILLHGGGAGADSYGNWRGSLPLFARDFDVIAMDMVGFGNSAKPDPAGFEYSQQARVAHLIDFIQALDIGPVNLVGNSMGGMTSMGAAIERPELVNRVVLMGSAGVQAPMSDALKSIAFYDGTPEGMRRIVEVLTNPGFEPEEAMIHYRHAMSVQADTAAAYAATMDWIKARGSLYYEDDYMARLSVPTLVVNGKLDQVVPPSSAYRLLELVPQAWGCIIPDCGHWAMIEHPAAFAGIAGRFLLG
jgi:2-hydroxy-6-oxo-6-(2'-aminophenyl)hexa-2,4-dienoate hydrolase